MNGVMKEVDLRAFPMEIAKSMLDLGKALNMVLGVTQYNEAEIKLGVWLQELTSYRQMFWGIETKVNQKQSVIRFITLHTNNPSPEDNLAQRLLSFMNYYPTIPDQNYHETLSEDEIHG